MLLGVDVGGTFTDAVLLGGDGSLYTAKVPSTGGDQSRGVLAAVQAVLAAAAAQPGDVERFAHGMTVATNALLEGRHARTALVATEGFTDVVELGRQARPHLYRLCAANPAPLVPPERRYGAPERMGPQGVLRALERGAAEALVQRIAAGVFDGHTSERSHATHPGEARSASPPSPPPQAVAVALLHSYAHPEHERLLGELLAERMPGVHVSLSHELVGTFREYERAATTEIDAALSPLLGVYLRALCAEVDERGVARPVVMQSSGGLVDAEGAAAHAALTVLSGPAGGVRGAELLAGGAGERRVLCLDMGGTSCDVCAIHDGRVAETATGRVAGRPVALAMLDIHTVGAGGGSIAWRDAGGALRVGPRSAGAEPGPACYGRGGREPTVTDANVVLGRLPAGEAGSTGPSADPSADPSTGPSTGPSTEPSAGPGARPNTEPNTDPNTDPSAGPAATLAGGVTLDREAAQHAVGALAATLGLTVDRCAEGIVRVAEEEMRGALRVVSVQRGLDPRDFALLAFGGAGPLHAAALARGLGIERVLCPRASGVLCALGLAAAAPRRDAARTVMLAGGDLTGQRLATERAALVARASAALGEAVARVAVSYELRYRGQSFELAVREEECGAPVGEAPPEPGAPRDLGAPPASGAPRDPHTPPAPGAPPDPGTPRGLGAPPAPDALRAAFARAHEAHYGYRDEEAEVELVTMRASAWGAAPLGLRLAGPTAQAVAPAGRSAPPQETVRVRVGGEDLQVRCVRGELRVGMRLQGPVVCALPESTLWVPPGWEGEVDEFGTARLRDGGGATVTAGAADGIRAADAPGTRPAAAATTTTTAAGGEEIDAIELQVVAGALRAACEEMGAVLMRAAHSANIKERRDCSTALFDADGQMTMQAEHIPVHLGAMPAAVAAVLGEEHRPGVSWMLNDPFAGGTHLPDITVVTPVFAVDPAGQADERLIGFAASRAHHADVGGRVPGSMPADSRTLAQEGVVISPRPMNEETIAEVVAGMRGPAERQADLRAQLAANRVGALRLAELARRVGVRRLRATTDAVLDYAERRTRACIAALPDGVREAQDVLEAVEGDLRLVLRATVAGERLVLDFAGSAGRHAGNLNCPLAVTRSACYFAARVLTDPDIPPSAGAYRPIEVRVPEGSLLNAVCDRPGSAPAVAAGNVETSSRVADLVLAAFGHAQGQGTMNNVTFGDERFAYYETLGGGQGACADAGGPSGVHVAMSNTLNTPVEALEREFPLRVTRYELRRGSGGAGGHRGGEGVVREVEALREMSFSLIGERRRHQPRGAHGGAPGATGQDWLDGERLPGKVTGQLRPGARLRIETPGGGGFGYG